MVERLHLCLTYDVDVEHIVPYLLQDGCDADDALSYNFFKYSLYRMNITFFFLFLFNQH